MQKTIEAAIRKELKPTLQVRQFIAVVLELLNQGKPEGDKEALLRLKLLTEAWNQDRSGRMPEQEGAPSSATLSAHTGSSIRQTMMSCFFSQGNYFKAFSELAGRGLIEETFWHSAASLAQDILRPAERDANNRSFFFAIGMALASGLFPALPEAKGWSHYAEGVWNDWYGPGDCYEPGYVAHNIMQVIELGLILGKAEELRSDKALAAYRRYRDHISPSGLAIQPGDGGTQAAYVDALALMAKVTGDGTFLWAAQQAFLAGEYGGYYNAVRGRIPAEEAEQSLEARFAQNHFEGIKPELPDTGSEVQTMYPATYRIPDRLLLSPSKKEGTPYAAFYINDRMETLHHAHEDNRGDLYHYEVNGVMVLQRSGWHKWAGQSSTLVVGDALSEFPFNYTQGMLSGRWYKASSNLRLLRDFMASDRYEQLYRTPEGFRHTGVPVEGDETMMPLPHFFRDKESPYGVFLCNPEGMAGKNESLKLESFTISLNTFLRGGNHSFPKSLEWYRDYREVAPADGPVEMLIRNIHLGGPAGKRMLVDLRDFAEYLEVAFYEDGKKGTPQEKRLLTPEEVRERVSLTFDELSGAPALKIVCHPGRTDLTWRGFGGESIHLTEQYQRIGFDYLYISDVRDFLRTPVRLFVNGMTCRSMYVDGQQGGVLKDARAEQRGEDSFGSMEYEGVYTFDSHWKRQTVLTQEGYLLVVDRFLPGAEADRMTGGPVWQVKEPLQQGLFWYDSAADRQHDTNVLVYFHPQRGHQYGAKFQPKLWNDQGYAVYDKTVFTAGREEVFVSVILPHDSALSGSDVSGKKHFHSLAVNRGEENKGVATEIRPDGTAVVELLPTEKWKPGRIRISVQADGGWSVER